MIRKAGFRGEKGIESAENCQSTHGFGNTWPDCIGEHAASLAKPRNWAAACARTQMAQGCDIGTTGRALLAEMHGEVPSLAAERGAQCQMITIRWKRLRAMAMPLRLCSIIVEQ